ncbi:MAG: hybrid sensor histidine kinase/response regulator [Verrucomicrobia bacterium]|nr:hybrid sensor histidine kinase/response regulator [Verrucomicrobiota bacterium]
MEKILVIEDDPSIRQVIYRALGDDGYDVLTAENGLVGTEMARAQRPDLILCDVRMDVLDGFATLEALRRDKETTAIPFILMTGYPDADDARHGAELGADGYLPKPFSIPQLRATVRAKLKQQWAVREQADQRMADLTTAISCVLPHELRTPLNGILGFAEMIVSDYPALQPQEVISMAQAIIESAQRLHRLTENMLLFAQIELAAHDPAKLSLIRAGRTADIRPPITARAKQCAQAASRELDLHLDLAPLAAAMAPDHLSRVIAELVGNAFKFSLPGSSVQVSAHTHGAQTLIAVRDAGRGMKPEHVAAVGAYVQFERKFHEQQGSGLGLAIAKRLAELHAGTLAISSQVGLGTTVTVTLPTPGPPP